MRRFTSWGFWATEMPPTQAEPAVADMMPESMRIVVLLPAPLGPRKPTISPRLTVKLTFLIAVIAP